MPNGTYGGVRGRKTEVGGKLITFVFLLLDYYSQLPLVEVPLAAKSKINFIMGLSTYFSA